MITDITPHRQDIILRATTLALALCVACSLLTACAPQTSDSSKTDSPASSENSGELAPLTENIYYQGDAEPINEPYKEGAEPSKNKATEGTPNVDTILKRCTGSCHDIDELNAYSGTTEAVRKEMESMADYIDPKLTDNEIAALTERFSS